MTGRPGMRVIDRRLILALPATLALWLVAERAPAPASAADTCRSIAAAVECRVTPDVRSQALQPVDALTQLQFGDIVTVHGEGCVHTGGLGLTRKRYVDPQGPNSDRLYHGRVWIPGATDGLVRISAVQDRPLIVGKRPPHEEPQQQLRVKLGYEDDDYSDNSFDSCLRFLGICYRKDDGTADQCRGAGDPAVTFTVARGPVPPADAYVTNGAAAPGTSPFDLVWQAVDDNYLPFNPQWNFERLNHAAPTSGDPAGCDNFKNAGDALPMAKSPLCTTWDPDVDEASILQVYCHAIGGFNPPVHGHVNWGAVTYTGAIFFADHQVPAPLDNDYHLFLETDRHRGVTAGGETIPNTDKPAVTLEFNFDETLKDIQAGSWWSTLRDAVLDDRNIDHQAGDPRFGPTDWPRSHRALDGRSAIAIGLMGLDNEHFGPQGASPELHPVYALAVQSAGSGTHGAQRWTIFARNWGTEGGCSHSSQFFNHRAGFLHGNLDYQHDLSVPDNKIVIFIPTDRKPTVGAAFQAHQFQHGNPAVSAALSRASVVPYSYNVQSLATGALVTLGLPDPGEGAIMYGDVTLDFGP